MRQLRDFMTGFLTCLLVVGGLATVVLALVAR